MISQQNRIELVTRPAVVQYFKVHQSLANSVDELIDEGSFEVRVAPVFQPCVHGVDHCSRVSCKDNDFVTCVRMQMHHVSRIQSDGLDYSERCWYFRPQLSNL